MHLLTNKGNIDVLESCVRRCGDGNMSCNGVHGGIAWDRTSRTIAVVDNELDVWLTDACERPNFVANLVS